MEAGLVFWWFEMQVGRLFEMVAGQLFQMEAG